MRTMNVDIRFLSFFNTHLAIIALIAPWYKVTIENTSALELTVWEVLSMTPDNYEEIAKPRAVAAFLVISFIFAVIMHIVLVLNDWMGVLKQKTNVYVLLVTTIGQIISSLIAFSVWVSATNDDDYGDGLFSIEANPQYVGFAFAILHMILSAVISGFVIRYYIM